MSKFLTRRNLLATAPLAVGSGGKLLLPGGGKLLAPSAGLAWQPATKLGMAVENSVFYNTLAAGQKPSLWPLGVSYIRGIFNCYWQSLTSSYPPNTFSTVSRPVLSIQPYAADPTQLQLNCQFGIYAVPSGDTLILSVPISYQPPTGSPIVLPARTPITCTGGTVGTFNWASGVGWTQPGPSTIRVAAGGTVPNNGVQTLTNANVLHQNFYTSGTTLRWEFANIAAYVNEWLAQGFAFDLGGYMDNWGVLYGLYGINNVLPIREQEWAYFAAQGWNPARVMISDENEFFFADYGWGNNNPWAWQEYAAYFQATLYPRMRYHFPNHTLGFGGPWGGDPNGAPYLKWWPNDPNTMLRLHVYLGPGSYGVTTGTVADITNYFTQVNYNLQRIGVPAAYMQEFGFTPALIGSTAASVVATWVGNLRRAALQMGWGACGYCMSTRDSPPGQIGFYGYMNANGVWVPELNCGAFGLT